MGLLDSSNQVEFPYERKDVFQAVLAALNDLNIGVGESDEVTGRITASTGISLTSFGERISVTLMQLPLNHTAVQIMSASKSAVGSFIGNPIMNAGRNGRIVDRIFSATSRRLQSSGAKPATCPAQSPALESPAARIAQLETLLAQKLISQVEYDQRRADILSKL